MGLWVDVMGWTRWQIRVEWSSWEIRWVVELCGLAGTISGLGFWPT